MRVHMTDTPYGIFRELYPARSAQIVIFMAFFRLFIVIFGGNWGDLHRYRAHARGAYYYTIAVTAVSKGETTALSGAASNARQICHGHVVSGVSGLLGGMRAQLDCASAAA